MSAKCKAQSAKSRMRIAYRRSPSAKSRTLIQQHSALNKHSTLCALRSALKGYTLIEVLVSLVVLIIGFSALTTMTTRARRAAIAAEELSTVQLACQTRVNEMLAGVRPFGATFNEPVTGLDDWLLTIELYPASKPGITAMRVQMSRQRQPGEIQERLAGVDFFEITHWINNSRLDPELVQAMQRNPYAMTAAAMMPNPQLAMGGMMPPGMMPPGMMPGMTAQTSLTDYATGGGMMPPLGYGATMSDGPSPLALDDVTGRSSAGFTTTEDRRAYRESLGIGQRRNPAASDVDPIGNDPLNAGPLADSSPDVVPLDIPLNDPRDSTVAVTPTPTDDAPNGTSTDTPSSGGGNGGNGARPQGGGGTRGGQQSQGTQSSGDTQGGGRNRPQSGTASSGNTGGGGGNYGEVESGGGGGGNYGDTGSGGRPGGGQGGGNRPNAGRGN